MNEKYPHQGTSLWNFTSGIKRQSSKSIIKKKEKKGHKGVRPAMSLDSTATLVSNNTGEKLSNSERK